MDTDTQSSLVLPLNLIGIDSNHLCLLYCSINSFVITLIDGNSNRIRMLSWFYNQKGKMSGARGIL